MLKTSFLGLALVLLIGVTGCASNSHRVIARRGSAVGNESRRVALMPQPHMSSDDTFLRANVRTALTQHGFQIVEPDQADLTLTCQLEKGWKTSKHYVPSPYLSAPQNFAANAGMTGMMNRPDYLEAQGYEVEDSVALFGIRLQFYDSASLKKRRFESVWEGYVEGGVELAPEKQPELLGLLLDHYGNDFSGRVKLQSQ